MTQKLLACYKMHHQKVNKDRLHLPRAERGRSLLQIELTYKTTAIGLHKYLETTKEWIMELLRKHKNSKKLESFAKESRRYMRELNIGKQEGLSHNLAPTEAAKKNETGSKIRKSKES